MRGRKKKPESLKKLNGNPGKRKPKKLEIGNRFEKLGFPNGLSKQARIRIQEKAEYLEKMVPDINVVRASFERWCYLTHFAIENAVARKKDEEARGAFQDFLKASAEARQIEDRWDKIILGQSVPEEQKDPLSEFLGGEKPQLKAVK